MSFKRFINCVETHDGEPMRVVTGGVGHIPGNSVYEMAEYLRTQDDSLRKFLLREPRGYPPMCCNILVPPKHPDAAAGFIIMEQVEYPMMSGGNTISVATVLLETGIIPSHEGLNEFNLEAPAGLIGIKAMVENGKVTAVTFKNVPAFAEYLDKEIAVPHIGHGVEKVVVDVAWGGMFYVMADVNQFPWVQLIPEHGREIARISSLILKAAQDQLPVENPDYPGVGITISQLFKSVDDDPEADVRNAVTVASGEVDFDNPATWIGALDRCACDTGTCARLAAMHAKGQIKVGGSFRNKGVLDVVYKGECLEEVDFYGKKAVIPAITGRSWIYGFNNLILDPTDPFQEGFTVGDIWA
ncbi:MAG: proline racemase family protein [Eubacteriaceae bacterium]|jgi:proline racemase|nr:proline racemase family protein [Eubacteriaceae bacterium]